MNRIHLFGSDLLKLNELKEMVKGYMQDYR